MKKRLLSLFLAFVTLLGILPAASLPALAASSVEDALGEIDIFNGGQEMGYLSINGSVRRQKYTYYIYRGPNGRVRETPAYCVNPTVMGVPQTVEPGESIKYIANEKASDPKVVGIVCSGYQPWIPWAWTTSTRPTTPPRWPSGVTSSPAGISTA